MKFNNNFEYISKEDIKKFKSCKLNHSVNVKINGVNKTLRCLKTSDNPCNDCFFYKHCNSKTKKIEIPCCDWEKDDEISCIYKEIK